MIDDGTRAAQIHHDAEAVRTLKGLRSAAVLRIAGWAEIVLALTLGCALAVTWAAIQAGPRGMGAAMESALGAADQSLAATEAMLEASQPQILKAQQALMHYATFAASIAETCEQTAPLLRAWGADTCDVGKDVEAMGATTARLGLLGAVKEAGEKTILRGQRLRATGAQILQTADALEKDALPAIRRTSEILHDTGTVGVDASSRHVAESVAGARETICRCKGFVSPAMLTLRLTCGVYAAMTLVLLLAGVTMVLLGQALGALVGASTAAPSH